MAKYAAKGSIFKWTVSASLTTVAQVRSIETDHAMPLIDSTDLADTIRSYVASILDGGTVTLELVFDPDGVAFLAVQADMISGTSRACQISWSTGGTEDFTAFATKIRKSGSEGGLLVATIEFQVTTTRTLA